MKPQRQESGRENQMLQSWSLLMVCGLSQARAISFFSHGGYADRAHLTPPLPASRRYSPNMTLLCGGGLMTPTPWCVSETVEGVGCCHFPHALLPVLPLSPPPSLILHLSSQDAVLLTSPRRFFLVFLFW